MKLLFIAFIYYIEAFIFDIGIMYVMKMKPYSQMTAVISRKLEILADRMLKHERDIKKCI